MLTNFLNSKGISETSNVTNIVNKRRSMKEKKKSKKLSNSKVNFLS